MNKVTQILQSSKVANAKNTGLSIPIELGADRQLYAEYNAFKRINQLNQFYTDKKNCQFYRFYGHVNEIVNLKFNFNTQPKVEPNFNHFDFTVPNNWDLHLMASLAVGTGNTENRGDYEIKTVFDGAAKSIDLKQGLPALPIKNEVINNKTRRGVLMYLGHKLQNNDLVHLVNTENLSENGIYRVVYVLGNKVYFQIIAVSLDSTDQTNTAVPPVDRVKIGIDEIELGITTAEYDLLAARNDVNWLGAIIPHIFIKKLVNQVPSEYYLKKLYSIGKIDNFINCGYSNNSYNQKTFSFTNDRKFYFEHFRNNLLAPVTDVYIAFIKNIDDTIDMTSVQANFSNFIGGATITEFSDYCFSVTRAANLLMPIGSAIYEGQDEGFVLVAADGTILDSEVSRPELGVWSHRSGPIYLSRTGEPNGGIQTVNTHYHSNAGGNIDYTYNENFLYHSLVEYNKESLIETEINQIEHSFMCNINDVSTNRMKFGFNPFHQIPIRKLSNTINEDDVYFGIPDYAVYSEKYQTYRWRTILEIGDFESQSNGIDFPYLNDAFYVFSDILLNIKNYSSPKVGALLTGGYLISAYTDTLTQTDVGANTTGNGSLDESLLDKNKNDKPFEQFNGLIC